MLLGNDQHVSRSLRIDIVEGIRMLIFVDFLRRYFPANNLAEQTVVHETVHNLRLGTRRIACGCHQDGEGACLLYTIAVKVCSAAANACKASRPDTDSLQIRASRVLPGRSRLAESEYCAQPLRRVCDRHRALVLGPTNRRRGC